MEIVTSKKTEEEDQGDSTKGNEVRPGDNLVADIEYSTAQTLTKPNMSMSCSLCTFKITCWTMKLAKQIIQNHQRRRHPSDHDGRQVVETQDEYDEIIWIISTIDIREEPADDEPKKVQETDAEGDRINDTCKEKEDRHKDFPKLR